MSRPADSVLGVVSSLTGKRWLARQADERTAMALAQRLELPEPVARVMAARGVGLDEAEDYLGPTLRRFLPDPFRLRDMDRAAARVARAVMEGQPIALFGDYDVDGATSSALLHRFLAAVGAPPRIYIPDRIAEGYGPNAPALLQLKDEGAAVVITVDCGIAAHEALAIAAEAELDVVVVDHHTAEPRLPPAHAVVNPNRLDDDSGLGQLAAVGVAFLLVVAVNRALREAGWYGDARSEPDLRQWLDLVALGTVCDVVPLTGLNRALVAQGLKVMAGGGNPGLAALSRVARVQGEPGTYHAGFLLGPRVNAGGRMGEAGLGARLLTAEDFAGALAIAEKLDAYNAERQALEAGVLEAARTLAAECGEAAALVVAGEGWHPGVIGIVASRLVERYNRPACVVALDGEVGKGSGRSVPGVDLGAAIVAARQRGLLAGGGGHPMAAGFTVEANKIDAFAAFLEERVARQMADNEVVPTLMLDGFLTVRGASYGLAKAIERLAPFGVGNPQPRFVLPEARVAMAEVVGTGHVRAFLAEADGGRLKAIAFRAADGPLGQALLGARGRVLHVAGTLRPDEWNGRTEAQLVIDDAAPA